MGHRAGTLARPGPKVQGQGSSQRRDVKRKAGVSLVVEMGGRAFHMNGTTCSKIREVAAAAICLEGSKHQGAIHPFHSFH